MKKKLHKRLWGVCRGKERYSTGIDTRNHELPDCSCGCKFFIRLDTGVGADWGVCINYLSWRSGLLTFEHMGCEYFELRKDG